jgi:L-ascorbate metabolism protein UlaG (beta-lactamase superfamily)
MRSWTVLVLSGLCIVLGFAMGMSGCKGEPAGDYVDLAASRSAIMYWGHSTFSITSGDGHVLLIDPYNPDQTGYPRYRTSADLVLITTEAYDHNDTSWCINTPVVVRGLDALGDVAPIDQTTGPFHVWTVPALRGGPAGQSNGNTAMFVVEVDGVRIAHLGDLGQTELDDTQLAAIGRPHFLMVPVGGGLTIDGNAACHVAEQQIGANNILPMHFRTAATAAPLAGQIDTADAFINCFSSNPVQYDGNGISLDYANVPTAPELLLLEYLP